MPVCGFVSDFPRPRMYIRTRLFLYSWWPSWASNEKLSFLCVVCLPRSFKLEHFDIPWVHAYLRVGEKSRRTVQP